MAKKVKITRCINIRDRVVTAADLRRIGRIFDDQQKSSIDSGNPGHVTFSVTFSDSTVFEADTTELYDDESLISPARPMQVKMKFYDFKLNRHLALTLNHGQEFMNMSNADIAGGDKQWVSENFLALKEQIDAMRPQVFWLRDHSTLLFVLIAIGTGILAHTVYRLLFFPISLTSLSNISPPEWLMELGQMPKSVRYVVTYGLYFVLGTPFAPTIRSWLLDLWPSVEFQFGSIHLQAEQQRRRRLWAVTTLVGLPIATNLISDIVKLL